MGDEYTEWRVKAWNRALARGVVTSKQVGDLPFDGSIALVDDFSVSEVVEVNVARDGETYRVTKVWPDDPRFRPSQPTSARAPDLDTEIERRIGALLRELPVSIDYRVARWGGGGDLVVEGDDSLFSYGAQVEVTLRGASYVELPSVWDGLRQNLAALRAYRNFHRDRKPCRVCSCSLSAIRLCLAAATFPRSRPHR